MTQRMTETDFRIQKANQLRELGINPYASKFDKQQNIGQLIAQGDNPENYRNIDDIIASTNKTVSTAGRLTLFRSHGKLSFGRLHDEFGEIQIMWHRDNCALVESGKLNTTSENSPKISLNFRDDKWWNELISGRKTIETRALNPDEPERHFGDIKTGDVIEFVHIQSGEKKLAKVKQTYIRNNFDELFEDKNSLPKVYGGFENYKNFTSAQDIRNERNLIANGYADRVEKTGLAGFEIEFISSEISPYKMIEKFLDVGDIIGVQGELFVTHKGELTIFVSDYQILSKAIRPLGDKFHGIGEDNQETAYRQRYLDMIFNRESLERMKLRSLFVKTLREFYWKHGFIELDTPILGNSASGAAAAPFVTHHNDFDTDMYLRIAPEIALKMATVGGLERVFEVGKDFRNEGSSPSHHQEFLVAEHYAMFWNYEDNMRFTEEMFNYFFDNIPQLNRTIKVADKEGVVKDVHFGETWERIDYIDRIKQDSGIDVSAFGPEDDTTLRELIRSKGFDWKGLDVQTTATMIDYLYKKVTRPKIVGPAFIYNYPKTMQPLARTSDSNPQIVEQFQAIINGWEILKAYSELVDPVELQHNFDLQKAALARGDDEATKSDDEFVLSMEYGMAPQSGWGMGLDRILAMLTEQANIRDVIMFPMMKPMSDESGKIKDEGEGKSVAKNSEVESKTDSVSSATHAVSSHNGGQEVVGPFGDSDPEILDELVQQAENLVQKYSTETQGHLRQVGGLMKHFAKKLGRNENYWYIVGLLHDVDRDYIGKDAARHIQGDLENIVFELDCSDEIKNQLIIDIQSHGPWLSGVEATTTIQKYLISIDELSGLMFAYARMRGGSFEGMEVKGVIKKIKDKSFAAGVDREHVRNCETYLGIALEDFVGEMIEGFLGL